MIKRADLKVSHWAARSSIDRCQSRHLLETRTEQIKKVLTLSIVIDHGFVFRSDTNSLEILAIRRFSSLLHDLHFLFLQNPLLKGDAAHGDHVRLEEHLVVSDGPKIHGLAEGGIALVYQRGLSRQFYCLHKSTHKRDERLFLFLKCFHLMMQLLHLNLELL